MDDRKTTVNGLSSTVCFAGVVADNRNGEINIAKTSAWD